MLLQLCAIHRSKNILEVVEHGQEQPRKTLPVERSETTNDQDRRGPLGNGTAFSAVAPSQRPSATPIDPKYSGAVFRSRPPGPNTWTLNIQFLCRFRPHRSFY